jgi:hypothetical protein
MTFALRRSRNPAAFAFENADLRAVFDFGASGGWTLEVVIRALFLATHPLTEAIALAERVARSIGPWKLARLRRFDLAADYVGFSLVPGDTERLATKRARVDTFLAQSKDLDEVDGELCKPAIREHRNGQLLVTGITIAAGNPLMGRIYDKTAELELTGREEKRVVEHGLWTRRGWTQGERVTRVQFQHRGVFLDDIRMRDPHGLEARLDEVWATDVSWVRLIEPSTATRRSRSRLDPRWECVVATTFDHQAEPIARRRNRGGASPEHVLGAAVSRLAATGNLARADLGITPDGELHDERTFVAGIGESEATAMVRQHVSTMMSAAASDVSDCLIATHGPHQAALRVLARMNAAVARFSSADDAEGSR